MLAKMEDEGQTVPLRQTPSHWRRNGPNFSRENKWDDPSVSSDFISTLNLTCQYFWGHRGRCWAETLNPSGSDRVAACQHFTVFIFNFTLTKSKAKRLESAEEEVDDISMPLLLFLFESVRRFDWTVTHGPNISVSLVTPVNHQCSQYDGQTLSPKLSRYLLLCISDSHSMFCLCSAPCCPQFSSNDGNDSYPKMWNVITTDCKDFQSS